MTRFIFAFLFLLFAVGNVPAQTLVSPDPKVFESRYTFRNEECQALGNPAELHVFILWSNARPFQDKIIEDLKKTPLTLLEAFESSWPEEDVVDNYCTLYGFNFKEAGEFKKSESGYGPFLIITALDPDPKYKIEMTRNGFKECNNNLLFQLKERYREWTGGGWKVHATASPAESEHDLKTLLGVGYSEYLETAPKEWDGTIKHINSTPQSY